MIEKVTKKELYDNAVLNHSSGYSCGESVMKSIIETLGFPLDEKYFNVSSVFAGGAMSGEICGTVCGAAVAAGVVFGDDFNKVPNRAKALTKRIVKDFKNREGCTRCDDLTKERGKGSPDQVTECRRMVGEVAAEAGEMIAKLSGIEVEE